MALRIPTDCKTDLDRTEFWHIVQEKLRLAHNAVGVSFLAGKISKSEWIKYVNEGFYPKSARIALELNKTREYLLEDNPDAPEEKRFAYDKEALRKSTRWDIDLSSLVPSGRKLGIEDPIEDFTGYTEVDTGAVLTVTSDTVAFSSMARDNSAYVYDDKGVGHFDGDFEHLLDTICSSVTDVAWYCVWMVSNDASSYANHVTNDYDLHAARWKGDTRAFSIIEWNGASATTDTSTTLSTGTRYYLKVKRDEAVGTYGTLYLYIYTDSGRTSLSDTLSITLTETNDWRYIYGINNKDDAADTHYASGDVKNLDLQEVSPTSIAAIAGITLANISEVSGIAKASIEAVAGVSNTS